jgi:hypothetical protein
MSLVTEQLAEDDRQLAAAPARPKRDREAYIREYTPGEFDVEQLPELPRGFRFATLVCWLRGQGQIRRLIAITDRFPT